MQIESRIPKLSEMSFDGALVWFTEMQCRDLLFHPEDDPADVIRVADGTRTFSASEQEELRLLLSELERELGHEQMIEAAYPVFMRAAGIQLNA
ncbi:MAG: hypothetical protein WC023_09680 [Rhodocyclaceae bacterium]